MVGAAEYLSWLEDPAHTRGVVGSIPTSATITNAKTACNVRAVFLSPHVKEYASGPTNPYLLSSMLAGL